MYRSCERTVDFQIVVISRPVERSRTLDDLYVGGVHRIDGLLDQSI